MSARSASHHESDNLAHTKSKIRSLSHWISKKRKRTNSPYPSPSPSPSLDPTTSQATSHSTAKKVRRKQNASEPQMETGSVFSRLPSPAHDNAIEVTGPISSRVIATPGRRRSSSAQQREILPPKSFTSSDFRRPQILSRPSPCQEKNGIVSQTLVRTGWRRLLLHLPSSIVFAPSSLATSYR
jgi:hypothetical protein